MNKLNLGCGRDKFEGYINCDNFPGCNPDVLLDCEEPLPFEDNSIDEVVCNHLLEHIKNFIPLMCEIHRVCKPGATIKIKVPFYTSWGQFNDPTHRRFFTPFTFDYFMQGNYVIQEYLNQDLFKKRKVKINYAVGYTKFLKYLMNPLINLSHKVYCRFFAWIFPSAEIYYGLEVLK